MGASMFHVEPSKLAQLGGGEFFTLTGDEGFHAATVQRLEPGEQVLLSDGLGRLAHGTVVEVTGKDSIVFQIVAMTEAPVPSPRLIVVQAIPKGDRGELAVEMLTEVGVDVIVPWAAQRCVAQWRGDKIDRGIEKWRNTARESAKQARRPRTPQVSTLASSDDVVRLIRNTTPSWVLHEDGEARLSSVAVPMAGDIVLVVGPEGGVSPQELDMFAAAGAQNVRLGPSVLRTSTAGAVAAGIVLARTTRWA